jgi:hypothetical protein
MKGLLEKMDVNHQEPIQYTLNLDEACQMNRLIGSELQLEWTGRIICCSCGKQTKTSFGQGFCYTCFTTSPMASPCIINPELCRAHLGEGRDVEWEERNHNQPHIVYLASTDNVKVGITSYTNRFTRWIDQGAAQSIILAETSNRYEAGLIEVALKSFLSDKTNWQRMLRNEIDLDIDLVEEKGRIEELLPHDLRNFISGEDEVYRFHYPVNQFPTKVKSTSFDKTPSVSGKLVGIKGQYLLFEDERVLNIRKHTGYEVVLNKE